MNKFKKIAIGALLTAGAGCLAAAAGCNRGPEYFKLTFEGKGLDYVFQGDLAPEDGEQFVSGYEVKSGVEVRFTLALSENAVGTPVILLNGTEIAADENGVYSFVIDQDSTVSVSGLEETKTVTFSTGDWYKFLDEDGNEITDVTALKGDSVRFKVWVSPYMVNKFTITNDTEELEPENGVYTISNVADNSTVNIMGLEQEESFLERGEGDGTEENPFIVRKPIDMFMVAALVNSDFYASYSTAYYKLEEDIDMQGEKLFVIGDNSNSGAIFCGSFDGNGHKISNFYITDEVVDQESFSKEYLPFVGVFGYACATTNGPAVIKNLTLEDYEITIHPEMSTATEEASHAGSLVAYGIGVQIDGCKAINGKVTSYNVNKKMSYVGGLVGVLRSAYSETKGTILTYDAYVNGCSADVEVGGRGAIRCAGGAVGVLSTADTHAIAYISNTVTSGNVSGAMHAGGIVGDLGRFSSVANCYSSAAVNAVNTITTVGMDASYKSAYAGGIAAFAENDCVITGCYSANTALTATSASNILGKDEICAMMEEALAEGADSAKCVVYNNLKKESGHTADVFTSLLGWAEGEWDLTGAVPVYRGAQAQRSVVLTVKSGTDEVASYERKISSPEPIYVWYEDTVDEYFSNTQGRSWGYYFDKELTKKVPYGFIPLSSLDLYVGFANYSEVEGQYYLGKSTYGINATIVLDNEGGYTFRDGGLNFTGTYSYDGENIILYNSCLGALVYTADQTNGSYSTVVMKKRADGKGYDLNGQIYVTTDGESYSSAELALTAVRKSNKFAYGEYSTSKGTLVLNTNGTGTYQVRNTVKEFTFNVIEGQNGDISLEVSIDLGITVENGVIKVNGGPVDKKDDFAGAWKTNAGSAVEYVFDGGSTVTCGSETATYHINKNMATFTLGGNEMVAVLEGDALYIDGVAYYLADGFTGSWFGRSAVSGETIELTLGGIGKDGYGEAEMTFFAGVTNAVSGQYSVTSDGVMLIYVGDTLYGELSINKDTGIASGSFFSFKAYSTLNTISYAAAEFKLYDLFTGVWECSLNGISSINFTGKTAGGEKATALVTDTNGKTISAKYSIGDTATSGEIIIGENTYKMTLDEVSERIALTLNNSLAGAMALRDDWSGVTLYDGTTSYKFDGRGNLGGKVTVSDGTELNYVIGADGLPEIQSTALAVTADGFSWGGKTLKFNTGFAKTWLKPITNAEITIGEVNANFEAQVTIDGQTKTYTFNPDRNTLTLSETDKKGATTVTTLSLNGDMELSIIVKGASDHSMTCLEKGKQDNWSGTFNNSTDGSSWEFDGHGSGEYGSGSATYTDANGKTTIYSYTCNELGLVYIYTGASKGMVFTEVKTGGYKRGDETKAYTPVVKDIMYNVEVRLNGEFLKFDGAGNVWNSSSLTKTEYTYKPVTSSYTVIIDVQGNKQLGVLTTSGGNTELTLNDYVEWTLGDTNEKYIFVGGNTGSVWLFDGEKYVWKYSYKVLEGVYYLTDTDEISYKTTRDEANKTFVLEEIKDGD